MADELPPTPPPLATRSLAGIAQFGVFGLGLLYAVGMVIVNFHLRQYEVVSLELARPEYVMAGALWAFLTAISVGGVHWSVLAWKDRHKLPGWAQFLPWLITWVGWLSPAFIILLSLGYSPGPGAPWWAHFLGVTVTAVNGVLVYFVTRKLRARLGADPVGAVRSGALTIDDVILPFPWIFVALGLYTSIVFPDLPREIGGGRRPSVEVLLSEVPPVDWTAAGLTFSAGRKAIGPAMLVLDTATAVVVHRPETWHERRFFGGPTTTTLALERKLVAAVVYLPKGGGPAPTSPK